MLAVTTAGVHAQVVAKYDNLVTLSECTIAAFKNNPCSINTWGVRILFRNATIAARRKGIFVVHRGVFNLDKDVTIWQV